MWGVQEPDAEGRTLELSCIWGSQKCTLTPPGIRINATNSPREPQHGVLWVGLLCACVFLLLRIRINLASVNNALGKEKVLKLPYLLV